MLYLGIFFIVGALSNLIFEKDFIVFIIGLVLGLILVYFGYNNKKTKQNQKEKQKLIDDLEKQSRVPLRYVYKFLDIDILNGVNENKIINYYEDRLENNYQIELDYKIIDNDLLVKTSTFVKLGSITNEDIEKIKDDTLLIYDKFDDSFRFGFISNKEDVIKQYNRKVEIDKQLEELKKE